MHRNYISLAERGLQNITVETLFKLTVALNCSPIGLFTEMESHANSAAMLGASAPANFYPVEQASVWRAAEADSAD